MKTNLSPWLISKQDSDLPISDSNVLYFFNQIDILSGQMKESVGSTRKFSQPIAAVSQQQKR